MEDTSNTTSRVKRLAMSVDQPFLNRLDPESIRVFLRKYDVYCREVIARASQLTQGDTVSIEPVSPVGLIYCVYIEQLESAVDCGLIDGCEDIQALTDNTLRAHLENEAKESSENVTVTDLNQLVFNNVRMDMSVKSAKGRMKLLFMDYKSVLRRHGMAWVTENNAEIAIRQVISVVKPAQLKTRLEQDISFSHVKLKEDFKGFMQHAFKLSEAFEKIDSGPPKNNKTDKDKGSSNKDEKGNKAGQSSQSGGSSSKSTAKGKREPPFPCPLKSCQGKDRKDAMHWIDDCKDSTAAEKKKYKDNSASAKARDGPARSTRSQASSASDAASSSGRTFGRIQRPTTESDDASDSPSCTMTLSESKTSVQAIGRCDDGSDISVASPTLAETSAIKGIGKIEAIEKVSVEVPLTKKGELPQKYNCSRAWFVPRTVLHLNAGQLALKNINFLIPDDDVNCEEILIGRPVLHHLRVDTKTLLEDNIAALDGTDCSSIEQTDQTNGGKVSRIMMARLNHVENSHEDTPPDVSTVRPKVNYYAARAEEDPFPNPFLLDPIDSDQHDYIMAAVCDAKKKAFDHGLSRDERPRLAKILSDHADIFRTSFSSGPPARLPPLKIELTPDAKPVKVRLRNYSQAQRTFLDTFVSDLVRHGLAYPNPTSKWACAPLLVPKPGADFRFTSDLRPVNIFTIRHQYPMPNLDHELKTLSMSRFYANFDMSHSYWQLMLASESQELLSFITPDGIFSPQIPRPFGPAFHGTAPNDLLQFDYIDLGKTKSDRGDKYVLMLRDDHSDYKWFFAFPDTTAENEAIAIIEWCAAFGVPKGLMSDGPTHFKNEVLRLVCKGLKVPHHFTLPYCPWSNGAVERLGRELIRVLRSILSELKMRTDEWPDLLPIVQSVLNNSHSPHRDNICPITAFMGREPTPPVRTFMRSSKSRPVTLSAAQAERSLNVKELIKFSDELHPLVQSALDKHRQQSRQSASKGQHPDFTEGDYVLVARTEFGAGDKLLLRWRGPRRVTKAISEHVYQVEDLRTGHKEDIHASRIKFFRDDEIDKRVILSHVLQSEGGMTIARLMGLEEHDDGIYVHVRWKGLEDTEDTVEPIRRVFEDAPQMVDRLLKRKTVSPSLASKARSALSL